VKRAAIVTGTSSGIGRAIAVRLAKDGFHLIAHYGKNQAGAEETLKQIQAVGGQGELVQFDVVDSAAGEKNFDELLHPSRGLELEVLVNNAGITADMVAALMSNESFEKVIATNVNGPFYLMRYAVRKMLKQRRGSIVNITSLAGQTGNAGQMNYAASKAALIAMTKSLCLEVGARGIRVNAVAPGLIDTDMIKTVPILDDLIKRIPLGRVGTPDEVAGAVSFLCSPDATYISGHTLSVNGGLFPS